MNPPNSFSCELSPELQRIERQFAALVPDTEKERDLEVLRLLLTTQLNEVKKQTAYTEKTKLRTFLLGGTLGLCLGAVLTFFVVTLCFPSPAVPSGSVYSRSSVESDVLKISEANQTTQNMLYVSKPLTPELIQEFVPPPSAFFVPFFFAALIVVATMLVVRHIRLRVVI